MLDVKSNIDNYMETILGEIFPTAENKLTKSIYNTIEKKLEQTQQLESESIDIQKEEIKRERRRRDYEAYCKASARTGMEPSKKGFEEYLEMLG